jgi:hypothetical protein
LGSRSAAKHISVLESNLGQRAAARTLAPNEILLPARAFAKWTLLLLPEVGAIVCVQKRKNFAEIVAETLVGWLVGSPRSPPPTEINLIRFSFFFFSDGNCNNERGGRRRSIIHTP